MDPAAEPPSKGEQRTAVLLIAAAAAVLAAAVWSVPVWLSNDGPAHLFDAYASIHFHDEAKDFARYFVLSRPVTARGFLELYRLLDPLLPWQQAYRVAVVVIAELWAFAFLFAATSLHRARWPVGLCGFALALGWPLDLGLFSFWLATAAALATVGVSLRFGERRWLPLALALGLWLTACAHVFSAMLAGGVLVVIEAARRRGPERWRKLAVVIAGGVPAALVALMSMSASEQHDAMMKQWGTLAERLSNLLVCTLPGPWWRQAPLAMLAVASVALLLRRRRHLTPADAAIGGIGAVLLSLAAATPLHLRWMFFSPRFAPLGMAFLVIALPSERLRASHRLAVATALGIWVFAACQWSAVVHRHFVERVRPTLELLSRLETSPAVRLTVLLRSPNDDTYGIRYLEPWRQVGQLIALEQGGINVHGLAGAPRIHPLLIRPGALDKVSYPPASWIESVEPAPGPERRAQLTRLLAASTRIDELVLIGSDADVEQLLATGFQARARAPGVAFATFHGCAGRVVVEGPAGQRVAVDLGWWPLLDPAQGAEGVIEDTGSVTFDVDALTCDDVWLRVQGGRCANADDRGYVRGRLADGPLRCRLEAAPP